jgi:hypothetical protein
MNLATAAIIPLSAKVTMFHRWLYSRRERSRSSHRLLFPHALRTIRQNLPLMNI